MEEIPESKSKDVSVNNRLMEEHSDLSPSISQSNTRNSTPEGIEGGSNHLENQIVTGESQTYKERANDDADMLVDSETEGTTANEESPTNSVDNDLYIDDFATNKQSEDRRVPNAILPLLRYCQYESSESSCRYLAFNP